MILIFNLSSESVKQEAKDYTRVLNSCFNLHHSRRPLRRNTHTVLPSYLAMHLYVN